MRRLAHWPCRANPAGQAMAERISKAAVRSNPCTVYGIRDGFAGTMQRASRVCDAALTWEIRCAGTRVKHGEAKSRQMGRKIFSMI